MSGLPTGWTEINLFDVCRPRQWPTISTKNLTDSGYVVYGANGEIGFYKEYTHENPTVMITCRGASCGNIHISKPFAYINGNAMALDDLNESVCGMKYINYFLKSRGFEDVISGSAQPQITGEGLRKVEIPIAPIPEQKRIADKLDTVLARVDACRERLNRVPLILKRFKQSVLAAATSGKLTEDWRLENLNESAQELIAEIKKSRCGKNQNEFIRSDLNLFEIPQTWCWTSLQFLMNPEEDFCYGVIQPGDDDSKGAFLIRAGDIGSKYVDVNSLRRIPIDVHNTYRRSQLLGGEILITVVGAGIGEHSLVQPECKGFNIARAVAKIPIREFSAKYVDLWLSTSAASSWLKGSSREVARPTLNLEQLKSLPVPIASLAEQNEIVRRVETLFAFGDRLEARLSTARNATERLTPALLAKAFRGELVEQDPNDEPASVLLQKLASRVDEGTSKNKRSKKKIAKYDG